MRRFVKLKALGLMLLRMLMQMLVPVLMMVMTVIKPTVLRWNSAIILSISIMIFVLQLLWPGCSAELPCTKSSHDSRAGMVVSLVVL